MKSRRVVLCSVMLLTVACALAAAPLLSSASVALILRGPVYVWTGLAGNTNWNNGGNWVPSGGYPGTSAAGAILPCNSGTKWTVTKNVTVTIAQLKVLENVDLPGGGTVTANQLIFDSTDGDIEMTVLGGSLIGNP